MDYVDSMLGRLPCYICGKPTNKIATEWKEQDGIPLHPSCTQILVGSLFSGIGGLELGLERAGMKVVWQVENNEFCQKVLTKHWPDVKRYGDIRECGENLEPVDLICGGFPCQDVSVAGKRAGITGARSGLWFEFARIIRILRPRYVLVENVPGLLSAGFGRVLGDLAESGYDAEWDCIPAAAVGAPHLRYRLFIVAYPFEPGTGLEILGDSGQRRESAESSEPEILRQKLRAISAEGVGASCSDVSDTNPTGLSEREGQNTGRSRQNGGTIFERNEWWDVEPDVGRVANGVPSRVDRLKVLGNAVVPQVAEWIGRRIMEYENDQGRSHE